MLYQHLTDVTFRALLKDKYIMQEKLTESTYKVTREMTTLEGNALRYTASYVVRRVCDKFIKHDNELDSLMQLITVEGDCFDHHTTDEEWTSVLWLVAC